MRDIFTDPRTVVIDQITVKRLVGNTEILVGIVEDDAERPELDVSVRLRDGTLTLEVNEDSINEKGHDEGVNLFEVIKRKLHIRGFDLDTENRCVLGPFREGILKSVAPLLDFGQ